VGQDAELIIIGAGVAGLAAGCYARMNGYDVEIFEMHDQPGGMCTSWQRKGYTFGYCIHNLDGFHHVGQWSKATIGVANAAPHRTQSRA